MLQYDCQHKQRLLRKAINTNLIGENAMKKRIAVLLSIIMIFIFGFTVSAAEEDVTQDKTLIKHQYSGSKAKFNTVVNRFSSSSNWKNAQGMADQYQCHVNFAANKNPWNLEPWRPDVGILATMAAECNP